MEVIEHERNTSDVREVVRLGQESESPLDRIADRLNLWVGFAIVPLFALANAGVEIGGARVERVTLGVGVGLVVGKTVGVFGATWLACRVGIGRLPAHTTWRHLAGVAMCAGIGFTVALFVAGLSFDDPDLTGQAKVGILVGSCIAGVAGYVFLRASPPPDQAPARANTP